MSKSTKKLKVEKFELLKCPTGIQGVDEITFGGLPRERTTLVCGNAGCGKTLFAMEFLTRGTNEFNEPGVYMSFEENAEELTKNFSSLGFELNNLIKHKKLIIDHVFIERSEIEEAGEYDLEGLFVRLGHAIDSIGAKRVVLDTIEALFTGLNNENVLRAELRRLFRWLKTKGVTSIITGERGDKSLTRYGLEEYVADCVILLDHRVNEQISTRRFKIIKYRGSIHGSNEYPFLIDKKGLSVLPVTSLGLDYPVSSERISSGIKDLDGMLDNKGYYRGSAILVSGGSGTGKTSFVSHFADSVCSRGKKCIFFAFEESENQIIRDMGNIGINLKKWADKGLLRISASRPALYGLERHLVNAHNMINEFKPNVVVFDPISNLITSGTLIEAQAMLTRLIDFLKASQITLLMTDLFTIGDRAEQTEINISSLCDSWIKLLNIERGNERTRIISILKSRGMHHSNQIREFFITNNGVQINNGLKTKKAG
ncbi:MAG: circadian clock protein KaiC [Elusimicrobia bacterium]|nr:circadian clock protein KaiC [Candidatus Liberimonas magnetica]